MGTPGVTTIVVLDPAGTKPHADLPGTWRSLAQRWRVLWVGHDDSPDNWDSAVADVDGPFAVLAGGAEADVALAFAEAGNPAPTVVLLVDPGTDTAAPGRPALAAAQEWMRATADRREDLTARGIDVRLVAASVGGHQDRVHAPLPLGHPDVVAAIETALGEDSPDPVQPDAPEFDDPEDFADAAGVDPTPDQVDDYRDQLDHRAPGS